MHSCIRAWRQHMFNNMFMAMNSALSNAGIRSSKSHVSDIDHGSHDLEMVARTALSGRDHHNSDILADDIINSDYCLKIKEDIWRKPTIYYVGPGAWCDIFRIPVAECCDRIWEFIVWRKPLRAPALPVIYMGIARMGKCRGRIGKQRGHCHPLFFSQ